MTNCKFKFLSDVLVATILLAPTFAGKSLAGDRSQRPWPDVSAKQAGARLGSEQRGKEARASAPEICATAEGKAVGFDFGFDAGEPAAVLEAEKAKLNGVSLYADPGAFGGWGIGTFGEVAGDSVTFEQVPRAHELSLVYANATGSPKQCSLYVNGKDVATLTLTNTGGWFSPYSFVTYKGEVSGTVKVSVDTDDFATNRTFCCNLDAIIVGPLKPESTLDVPIQFVGKLDLAGTRFFTALIKAPAGLSYSLAIKDSSGVEHVSLPQFQESEDWQPVCMPFNAWAPPLPENSAVVLEPVLTVRLSNRWISRAGKFLMARAGFGYAWISTPPKDCPFPPSRELVGISFTGRRANYESADTWYLTWGDDGNQYSPYADGTVGGVSVMCMGDKAATGNAKLTGDDPQHLVVTPLPACPTPPAPYGGRYPCGSLVHNGVWYYGTYLLDDPGGECGNWCVQGPFVGFRVSKDYGQTWTECPFTPPKIFFNETTAAAAKVKMGAPHFVDFGRNMEHSPDGKAYLVAHGAVRPEAKHTWVSGDQIYMARVKPTPENINDPSKYEFFAGHDASGKPVWTSQFSKIKPLMEWNDNMGCVTMTYLPGLRKYITFVTHGWPTIGRFDTYALESDGLTGPFRLITYMKHFGVQGYFVNLPSRFVRADGKGWLCYSANFTGGLPFNPPGGYSLCLQEIELLTPGHNPTYR